MPILHGSEAAFAAACFRQPERQEAGFSALGDKLRGAAGQWRGQLPRCALHALWQHAPRVRAIRQPVGLCGRRWRAHAMGAIWQGAVTLDVGTELARDTSVNESPNAKMRGDTGPCCRCCDRLDTSADARENDAAHVSSRAV